MLTTVNQVYDRIAMHAVRSDLLRAQAKATGLPLREVPIPSPCSNEAYEFAMSEAIKGAKSDGISLVAFGDLFLEDIRRYREERLEGTGVSPIFPIWGMSTPSLAREMVSSGVKAYLTCVDPRQLSDSFAGSAFDATFLADLPVSVDPCGERGEFHTFVWDGPMFQHPVPVKRGEIVEREGFVFADLLLERGSDET